MPALKIVLLLMFLPLIMDAQKISGHIVGETDQPLSFSSVLIKNSVNGVSANENGFYSIDVKPGTYTIVCEHIGYITTEKTVTVGNENVQLDFKLPLQQYNLSNIVVTAGGEDPAYAIIRKAIEKRSYYEKEIDSFQCKVYIKGQLQLRDYPKKVLGFPVEFEDGDTSKKKMLFLSETVARYSVKQPDKSKIEVVSTRVSGNSDAYGLSFPQIISLYNNNISIGKNLNPRGFVSPIADNALNFYNYKFLGNFFENGRMINRIRVIPKRSYEPVFSGEINIIEDEWRIYSVQLQLLKAQQLQVLDTLRIEQMYMPYGNTWLIKQQVLYPAAKLLGFDGYGSFLQVYQDYNLHPHFPKNFFNNVILSYTDSSKNKPHFFWDTIRPVPLQPEEIRDYKRKDSLELVRKGPRYLDSLDKVRNKPRLMGMLITGQTFTKQKKDIRWYAEPLINILNYNTVEGVVVNISPSIFKSGKGRRMLYLSPNIRYGFSNQHFNAHLTGYYNFGKSYLNQFYFSGGQRVFQFNNDQPISSRGNSINTLLYKENNLKIYQADYLHLRFSKGVGSGFTLTGSGEYQDRYPLNNTSLYTFSNAKDKLFTPNYPVALTDHNISHHQALSATVSVEWEPMAKYIQFPDSKIDIGSKFPRFGLSYTHGIPIALGSDVNYSKWLMTVSDDIDFKLAGRLNYRFNMGGFLNRNKLFIPDYQHFHGNLGFGAGEYLKSFQIMPYYQYSTTEKFYSFAHVEYHLNGLVTNKIPLFRKLNWFLVLGSNALYISNNQQHYEYFFSIENILKIVRFDFVQTYEPNGHNTSGIKFSLSGLLYGARED